MSGPGAPTGPSRPDDAGLAVDQGRLQTIAESLGQPLADVARTLRDELRTAHAALVAALAAGDLGAVGDAAHAARNSALMVGATTTLATLRELEAAAGDGEWEAARTLAAELGPGYASLLDALGSLAAG